MEFTAIIEKSDDGWYVGQIEELPAAISQDKTIEELPAAISIRSQNINLINTINPYKPYKPL